MLLLLLLLLLLSTGAGLDPEAFKAGRSGVERGELERGRAAGGQGGVLSVCQRRFTG